MAVNVGSSSIKTSVFYKSDRVDVNINFIGLAVQKVKVKYGGLLEMSDYTYQVTVRDDLRKAATVIIDNVVEVLERLGWPKPSTIGHRVKFAGYGKAVEKFTKAKEEVMQFNDYLSSRHNTLCLEVLGRCKMAFPSANQLMVRDQVVEDLSLHKEYKIPFSHSLIRRYGLLAHGYHGLAIKACLEQVKEYNQIKNFSGVICQVGSGVSFSAVENGKLIYNTMQYAACDGPVMHNRAGTQPPGISLRLLKYGLDPSSLSHVYNRLSGIYGLAGLPADSTTTVEDILCLPKFNEVKLSYLKANGVELFRTIAEVPSANSFIFSGGLATKHRWLGPTLLYNAKVISIETMEKLVAKLSKPEILTVEADGITLYLVDIDEQICILDECEKFSGVTDRLGLSQGVCEVPGTAIGTVHEGKNGWGQGKICLCLSGSDFLFGNDDLPEGLILVGAQRSEFFFRASCARNMGIPTIFFEASTFDLNLIEGKKIYLDTPTRSVVTL